MNTEINFLEKQKKQSSVPVFLLILFIVLLISAAGVLFMQHRALSQSIDAEQSTLSTLQTQVAEQEEKYGSVEKLKNTEQALNDIKQDMIPRVALYEDVLQMLNEPEQLQTVSYASATNLQLEAEFNTLNAVSNYVGRLLEKVYVTDTKLSNASKNGDSYHASLKLTLDPKALREELGADAE